MQVLFLSLLTLAADARAFAPGGAERTQPDAVRPAKVVSYAPDTRLVGLDQGTSTGIAAGDVIYLLNDSGVAGSAEVFYASSDRCAGYLGKPADVSVGQAAAILRRAAMVHVRDAMPPGATVQTCVARVAPGRLSAWLDAGSHSGLRMGDQVLISRKGLPLSRGRITVADDAVSLCTLDPLVGNALSQSGDVAELWPAPADARWGRLNSAVLSVETATDAMWGKRMIIPGTPEDGVAEGRLLDVYRERKFIGVATVVAASEPNSKAAMILDASVDEPVEGDRVVMRSSAEMPAGPLLVPVFRIEQGDYCLIGTGEADGVQKGEKFLVRRQDPNEPMIWHDVAELTAQDVKVDYAGATIRSLNPQTEPLRRWDMAERQLPGLEKWRPVGILEKLDEGARTAVASINPDTRVVPGRVVSLVPEREGRVGAGIVLRAGEDRLVLHVPEGWGEMKSLGHARVDVRGD